MRLPNISRVDSHGRLENAGISPTEAGAIPISYVPIRNRSVSNKRSKSPVPSQPQYPASRNYQTMDVQAPSFQQNMPDQIHDPTQAVSEFEQQQQLESTKRRLFAQANYDLAPHTMEPTQANVDDKLVQRCTRLEAYCKDLINTNKVLDTENKLAIAQIVHLLDPNQLSNFTAALRQVEQAPKTIYKKEITSGLPMGRQGRSMAQNSSRTRSISATRAGNTNMPRPSNAASTKEAAQVRSQKVIAFGASYAAPKGSTTMASNKRSTNASRQASIEKKKPGGHNKSQTHK